MAMPDGFARRWVYCFGRASKFNMETEELIDFFVHRRLAAVLVATMGALDMPWLFTPNRITFASLGAGVCSAYCVFRAAGVWAPASESASGAGAGAKPGLEAFDASWLLWAAALELLSITLDCCDGQLARMYGSGSLVGRVLDGVCDMLVALSHGAAWTYTLAHCYGVMSPAVAYPLLALSCVTFQQQAMMFDRVKNLFCLGTTPVKDQTSPAVVGLEESQLLEREIAKARATNSWGSYALLVWYRGQYMAVQNKVAKKTVDVTLKERTPLSPEGYRERWRSTMRIVSWCGTGSHAFLFYGLLLVGWALDDPRVLALWYPVNNLVMTALWFVCLGRVKLM